MAEFINITKKYGNKTVFENFRLYIPEGKISVITGESGCGKTTLLSIAAKVQKPDSGTFNHSGNIAYMFQEARLLPWMSAIRNIEAILPKEKRQLAHKYLSLTGMEGEKDKYPGELSGGMKQRISYSRFLAFAQATDANLLLLDEPFSSVDENTASRMIEILKNFSENKTVIYVTNNSNESRLLGGNIIKI